MANRPAAKQQPAAQAPPAQPPAMVTKDLNALVPLGEGARELDLSAVAAAEVCHLLTPVTSLKVAEGLLLWPSVAVLEPEDYYQSIGDKRKLSLGKSGLAKIADAMGIEFDYANSGWGTPPACSLCSERAERAGSPRALCSHNVSYKAVGWLTSLDGSARPVTGEKVWDFDTIKAEVARNAAKKRKPLDDGTSRPYTEAETREYMQGEITRLLGSRHAMCETKAWLRMIRMAAKIRADYTVEEAKKPWLAVRVQADLSPAETKQRALAASRQLYPRMSGLGATPIAGELTGESAEDAEFDDGGFVPAPPEDGGASAARATQDSPASPEEGGASAAQAGEMPTPRGEPACPKCEGEVEHVPGGVSKRTKKPYDPFWACLDKKGCGWKGNEPAYAVPATAGKPANGEQEEVEEPEGEQPPVEEPPAEAAEDAPEPLSDESDPASPLDGASQDELPMAPQVCANCLEEVSAEVIAYCRDVKNRERFRGHVYCRKCQARFGKTASGEKSVGAGTNG